MRTRGPRRSSRFARFERARIRWHGNPLRLWGLGRLRLLSLTSNVFGQGASIGGGSLIPSLPSAKRRVVDYKLCALDDISPVRVYYDEGVAERVEPREAENDG